MGGGYNKNRGKKYYFVKIADHTFDRNEYTN